MTSGTVKPIEIPVIGMTQLSDSISEVSEVKIQLIESMVNQLGSHVSNVQQQLLVELLMNFADIFAATPEDLGRTNTLNHQIDTRDASPSDSHYDAFHLQRGNKLKSYCKKCWKKT